jgi:hypothetical protein
MIVGKEFSVRARLVAGLMRTRADAERAVERVMRYGFRRDIISLVASDAAPGQELERGGAALGSLAAASGAVSTTVVIAGLGLVAAGPLAAALAGAGDAPCGLVGALAGAGVSEHRARAYEAGLREGAVLVAVHVHSERDAEILALILEYAGAEDVRSESAPRRPYDSFI